MIAILIAPENYDLIEKYNDTTVPGWWYEDQPYTIGENYFYIPRYESPFTSEPYADVIVTRRNLEETFDFEEKQNEPFEIAWKSARPATTNHKEN